MDNILRTAGARVDAMEAVEAALRVHPDGPAEPPPLGGRTAAEVEKERAKPPPVPPAAPSAEPNVVEASARRVVERRSHARREAIGVVARAMARRGVTDLTQWSVDDADTVWALADLLSGVHEQPLGATGSAIDISRIERAIRSEQPR